MTPEEIFDVDYLRLKVLASRQVTKDMYVGVRVDVEPYKVTGVEEDGELASGRIYGSDFSRMSAVGVSLLQDSRDHVFYPTKGIFGELSILPSHRVFGALNNFTRVTLDVAHYYSPSSNVVWATHLYAMSNIGDKIPFNQLALIGGAKVMRGMYYGYFRDKNALVMQEELRLKIWKRLGMVVFGGVASLGNENRFLRLNQPKFTYGTGIRIATKNRLNIRLDYGMSLYDDGNFYVTIGEAF